MDPKRFKQAYEHLQSLDERQTHRVRPARGGSLTRPGPEQMEAQLRDLAAYTIELKEVLHELFVAIGSKPQKPGTPGAAPGS